jgi:hypothetical protein
MQRIFALAVVDGSKRCSGGHSAGSGVGQPTTFTLRRI